MCEVYDEQENGQFQLITFDGDTVIGIGDVSELSGNDKVQFITLEEAQAKGWNIDLAETSLQTQVDTNAIEMGTPIIEEENSSDNLPAIGHLENFVIQQADDGTLLPSTVNAKMADGSYQRLTLFPQIVDGNVTCVVQFENDPAAAAEESKLQTILSDKIDSIIYQNEGIIANSKIIKPPLRPKENISLLKPSLGRQTTIPTAKKMLPIQNHQMSRNSALHFPINDVMDPTFQLLKFKDKPVHKNIVERYEKRAEVVYPRQSVLKPISTIKQQYNENSSVLGKCIKVNDHYWPAPPQSPILVNGSSHDVSVKNGPEFFMRSKRNQHPLGSTENPITLLQSGQIYQSQQTLSETQFQHITTILKNKKENPGVTEDKNVVIDPKTKTKITYRVVYPDDDDDDNGEENKEKGGKGKEDPPKPKRAPKRVRQKGKDLVENEENNKADTEAANSTVDGVAASPPPKIIKVPRTRSGRLSRPPRYMIQDYKRLPPTDERSSKAFDHDIYVDYKNTEEEEPPSKVTELPSLDGLIGRRKKKNFKSEYRCRTCHKLYLGPSKMMLHLRKFPDHSSMDEYMEIYNRARNERKSRPLNTIKLKQILSGVDKSAYGPLLARAFSLWDFLLLRVCVLHKGGMEEMEALLKEMDTFLEKLRKMAEELLSPVFQSDSNHTNDYLHVEKPEVATALGVTQGLYKVNKDRLNLLKLAEDEPVASDRTDPPPRPPSRQSQLATKFEPNLSNKLLECSNDSIDLDCSSKDVEPEDDKKEWTTPEKVANSTEFLDEFLHNDLPSDAADSLNLWKPDSDVVAHVNSEVLPASEDDALPIWKDPKNLSQNELELWKENSAANWKNQDEHCGTVETALWKESEVVADPALANWREGEAAVDGVWKNNSEEAVVGDGTDGKINGNWDKKNQVWDSAGEGPENKKDWLRQWKEETGGPGLRTTRLTSTPETQVSHGPTALFSPPLRRNSVSSFATSNQEELLSLDLNDLFEDLMPEQGKARRTKPNTSTIESIINEALFTSTEPPASGTALPPSLIPDALDQVPNLDFLEHD